ncbi:AraC family transcriptional regulator [Paenibacillus arenilitoris]|uniref:Helix-turn-helix transcriptional regulator n=1 Tax=Paenibacillus arenilitoris TaxID=2772299 RepID=A0A927CMX3_9BACL|nr:AraC family transcriptional regulator [Paenibacillus arenilitoris]MBD2868540.1 helix-turn-helix transcriptional regulator [Paenibacillus arenilitoris]
MIARTRHYKGDRFFKGGAGIYVNRVTEAFTICEHSHDFIEVNYVAEGNGYHYIADRTIPVKTGDLFIIPVGTSHVFRPSSPNQSAKLIVYNCLFRHASFENWKHLFMAGTDIDLVVFNQLNPDVPYLHVFDRHERLQPLITTMHREFRQKYEGYETVLSAILIQVLLIVNRLRNEPESAGANGGRGKPSDRLGEALRFIQEHYAENITVKQLAAHAFMSESHFHRSFKRQTGLTFTQYLQNMRIDRCCALLKTSDQCVNHIANRIGYKDMKFFYTLFLKKTGMTPQQYRKSHQSDEFTAYPV